MPDPRDNIPATLAWVNRIRAALGVEPIDELIPGRRLSARQCVLARSIDSPFESSVVPDLFGGSVSLFARLTPEGDFDKPVPVAAVSAAVGPPRYTSPLGSSVTWSMPREANALGAAFDRGELPELEAE